MAKITYLTHNQILARIETEVERAGSQYALAQEWSINSSYLSNIRKGKQLPGPKVCRQLGVKSLVVYVEE